MRRFWSLVAVVLLITDALALPLPPENAGWPDAGLRWMKTYRAAPDPYQVPLLIRALSAHAGFKDAEASGIYIGFLAGVLAKNPKQAWNLIEKTLPLPFEDQWVLIRAVAYSGLPQWKDLMHALEIKCPDRKVMAEHYLTGQLPVLQEVALEPKTPSTEDKMKAFFDGDWLRHEKKEHKHQITFSSSPELIDTLWGLYYATGSEEPIKQIVSLIPWAKDRDSVEKLTVGSMAKFTLASNAARDVELLRLLKKIETIAPERGKPMIAEVIEAAETVDTGRLAKEALAAVDELKKKGPGSKRDLQSWGAAGEAALSMGCLGLAVAGQVEAGIPCVVGGALTTGALRYFGRPD
jgi:hypothetical protein